MVEIDHYYTIPDLEECDNLDPRTRNCRSFANTISLNGPNAATAHTKPQHYMFGPEVAIIGF